MPKSKKHLKRRSTTKKKTFKIKYSELVLSVMGLNLGAAKGKAHRVIKKRVRNTWAYKLAIKKPFMPKLTEFKHIY